MIEGRNARGPLRWRPAAVILAFAGVALAWLRLWSGTHAQGKVVGTFAIAALTALSLFGWALVFSGLGRRARNALLLVSLLGVAVLALLVEVRGFTGDLVPVLGWRHATRGAPFEPAVGSRYEEERQAAAKEQTWLDAPQFLGSRRDGVIEGVELGRDWDARGPRLVWRRPVGAAWSGFAVAGRDAITQEQRGAEEAVVCYDLLSGEPRWSHAHAARYEHPLGGLGPRATPAIAADRVYAMGATGLLHCLDRRTGALLWERDVLADAGAGLPMYGTSTSPLLHGKLVVVSPGGPGGRSLAAYDASSGAQAWSGGDDRAGYSSPVLAELAGVPQILSFNAASLAAHDPASGAVLWSVPWSDRYPNVAQPLAVPGDGVVISTGYGQGSARFRVAQGAGGRLAATEEWRSLALKSKFASFVHRAGSLYGLDDGILACIDAKSGRRRWKGGRYGHGHVLLAGELLLVMAESGEVVLVEAVPESHRELARHVALGDKTWNSPALAAPFLVVRNDLEAACFELPLAARESGAEPVR